MGAYRGTGGAVFEIDVPDEGTDARLLFDRRVESGDLVAVASETAAEDCKPAKVADVKAEVGDDVDKAREALEAEQSSDKPRSSLIEHLEAVIASETPAED